MKLTFLGTGTSQGVPIIGCQCKVCSSIYFLNKRLRSSVLIELDCKTIVIDVGMDFRQQMLTYKVNKIDAVLLTHGHKDHIGGLDELRAFNYILKKPIDIYCRKDVKEVIMNDFHYAFTKFKYPGVPEINLHTIKNESFNIEGIKITPVEVMHLHLKIFGYKIGDLVYVTDANFISDSEKEKIKGVKVLIINALRHKKHISHFTFDEAIELINELKPEKAYLTHISHQLGLHAEVEKTLPENIRLAYDGLVINT